MTDLAQVRDRARAHNEEIASVTWLTPSDLAARWRLAISTIHEIPSGKLHFKEFGAGEQKKRRRYRLEWVEAYENEYRGAAGDV